MLTTPLLRLVGRREDELVARQQHPADRAAGRDVRAHDADPGRAARGLVGARRRAAAAAGRADGAEARARPLDRRALARRGGCRGGGGALRHASCAGARRPRTCPRSRSRTATRCTCRRSSSTSFGVDSTSEARRLIEQGGVKLDGSPVGELDVPRATPRGRACCRSASAGSRALDSRLTDAQSLYCSGRPNEAVQ